MIYENENHVVTVSLSTEEAAFQRVTHRMAANRWFWVVFPSSEEDEAKAVSMPGFSHLSRSDLTTRVKAYILAKSVRDVQQQLRRAKLKVNYGAIYGE